MGEGEGRTIHTESEGTRQCLDSGIGEARGEHYMVVGFTQCQSSVLAVLIATPK